MTRLEFTDDGQLALDCVPCRGSGVTADDWCATCGGPGADYFDCRVIVANLVAAGALCAAWQAGRFSASSDLPWSPGCKREWKGLR